MKKIRYFCLFVAICLLLGLCAPAALAAEAPATTAKSAIVLDYAGFRTYDSMVRAYKVFGQRSFTVISQYWHNERAVYIARKKGMNAIAFNAQDVSYRRSYLKNHARESLAKVKVVWDVATNKNPRYWGEPVAIPDGQTTEYKDSIRHLAPTAE